MLGRLWKHLTSFARLFLHGPLCLPSVRYTTSMLRVKLPRGSPHSIVSKPSSVPDTCNCLKYSAPVSVAVEAELKVDVWTICDHSHSEMVTEFLRHERQQILNPCEVKPSIASRCIYNEQYISDVVFIRAGLATSPLMDGLDSLIHIEGLHRNIWIQNVQLLIVDVYEFIFFLQGTFGTSRYSSMKEAP